MLGRGKFHPLPSEVFIPIQAFENLSIIFQDFTCCTTTGGGCIPTFSRVGMRWGESPEMLCQFVPDFYEGCVGPKTKNVCPLTKWLGRYFFRRRMVKLGSRKLLFEWSVISLHDFVGA